MADKFEITLQNQLVNDSLILFGLQSVKNEPEEIKTEPQDINDDLNNDDNVTHYKDEDIYYDEDIVVYNDEDIVVYNDDEIVIYNVDSDYHDEIDMKEVSNKNKSDMELTEDEPEKKIYKLFPDPMLDIDLEVSNKRKSNIELSKDEPEKIMRKKTFNKIHKNIDLEETKIYIQKKLENGDVIDKYGNVIEVEVIVNNLHKLPKSIYNSVQASCCGDEPLTPEAIEVLSRIQKRYGTLYSSVFITKHLTTDEEIMEEIRKRETNQNYIESEHKCTWCFKYFRSSKMLENHIDQFHDPNNPYKCQYCEVTFSKRTTLWRHTQTHRVVYQCKLCPLVTSYITVLDSHCNVHTGGKYRCKKCNSVFKSRPALAVHMNSMHAENFVCDLCERMFNSTIGLQRHTRLKHRNVMNTEGRPSAKCEQCNIQFVSDEVYLEHQRKRHGALKGRACKKRTPCPNTKTPKYICRMCKHKEPSMGALIMHFKSEHPEEKFDLCRIALRDTYKYLCHLCGKGFSDITKITDHKNVHDDVRPYKCTECPKAFHSRQSLNYHMTYHGPPTYQCDICGKKFHCSANLCSHKRGHSSDRRYPCELCGKAFIYQAALNVHIRGVHEHIRRKRKHTTRTTIKTE